MTTNNYSGEMLRQLRVLKGIKQKDAAKLIGLSQQAYSKLEQKDHVPLQKLSTILELFNSSTAELNTLRNFQ